MTSYSSVGDCSAQLSTRALLCHYPMFTLLCLQGDRSRYVVKWLHHFPMSYTGNSLVATIPATYWLQSTARSFTKQYQDSPKQCLSCASSALHAAAAVVEAVQNLSPRVSIDTNNPHSVLLCTVRQAANCCAIVFRIDICLQDGLEIISGSATSHLGFHQLGLWQPNLEAAAMHAVLRVAAAEDISRQCRSFFVSHLSSKVAKFNEQQADTFGSASFGNACARPELTPLQTGELLTSARRFRQPTLAWHVQEVQLWCVLDVQDLQAHPQCAACLLPLSLADLERLGG